MQESKKSRNIIKIFVLLIVVVLIISIIFVVLNRKKDDTIKMYEKIANSQKYTFSMEGEDSEYSYKIIMAQNGTDICIDTTSKYEDEEDHNTTLITDGQVYIIYHNEQEYVVSDSDDIEADILVLEMKDLEGKDYEKGKENIYGKTYYYEEYADISTFLMLIGMSDEGKIKTRFYFDENNEIAYIKNIIEENGETTTELIKASCTFDADESLFEIPSDYAEI